MPYRRRRGTMLLVPLLLSGQQPARHTLDVDLDFSTNTSRSRWVSGYLPKYTREPPAVWMIDSNGKSTIPRTEISFPQTTRIDIRSVTADRTGNLYASAEVWSGNKAAVGVICRFSRDGGPALVIRTDDFLAVALAVTT